MEFLKKALKGNNNLLIWLLGTLFGMYPFYKPLYCYLFTCVPSDFVMSIPSNTLLVVYICVLATMALLLLFSVVKFLHKRDILSVITASKSFRWNRFLFGLITWAFIVIVYFSLHVIQYPNAFKWNFKLIPFLKLASVCFSVVLLRSAAIEIVFRGYLLQGFSILFNKKWLGILATSILYMIVFGISPVADKLGYETLLFYLATSILHAVITVLDDGTEIAIGMQSATNIIALLYVTSLWHNFQTDALLLDTAKPELLYVLYIPVFIFFPVYMFLLCKVFKWKNWKDKLLSNVK